MNFDTAFERLIGHEGGYTDNPKDRGNWDSGIIGVGTLKGTKFGIAAHKYPTLDIKNLTLEQAKAIYRRDYWDPMECDQLPFAVAFEVFDVAVNHGVARAVLMLQETAGVEADGDLGPVTLAAVNAMHPDRFQMRFNAARLDFYTQLSTWPAFGRGWARRVAANLRYDS